MSSAATAPDPTISAPVAADFDQALRVFRSMHGKEVKIIGFAAGLIEPVVCLYGELDASVEHDEEGVHQFGVCEDGIPSGWMQIPPDAVRRCQTFRFETVEVDCGGMLWEAALFDC